MTKESLFYITSPDPWYSDVIYGNISFVEHEIIECKFCGRRWQGKQKTDIEIELFGKNLKSFVWVDGPEIIVTRELLNIFDNNDLKGMNFRQVRITNIQEYSFVDPLFQMVIHGSAGQAANPTNVKKIDECVQCGWVSYAPPSIIYVDPMIWDGSDIFTVKEYPGFPIITNRFLSVLKMHAMENYQIKDIPAFI